MNNSCCVSDSSRLHLQRYDIRQGRFAHFGPRWFTLVLDGTLSSVSYWLLAEAWNDGCLSHK